MSSRSTLKTIDCLVTLPDEVCNAEKGSEVTSSSHIPLSDSVHLEVPPERFEGSILFESLLRIYRRDIQYALYVYLRLSST